MWPRRRTHCWQMPARHQSGLPHYQPIRLVRRVQQPGLQMQRLMRWERPTPHWTHFHIPQRRQEMNQREATSRLAAARLLDSLWAAVALERWRQRALARTMPTKTPPPATKMMATAMMMRAATRVEHLRPPMQRVLLLVLLMVPIAKILLVMALTGKVFRGAVMRKRATRTKITRRKHSMRAGRALVGAGWQR